MGVLPYNGMEDTAFAGSTGTVYTSAPFDSGTGSNRAVAFGVQVFWSSTVGTISATYGGVALTAVPGATVTDATGIVYSIYGLTGGALPSGSNTFQVTLSQSGFIDVAAIAVTGADQTGGATTFAHGAGQTDTATPANVTVTSASGNLVFAFAGDFPTTFTGAVSPGTLIGSAQNVGLNSAAQYASGTASVTCNFTMSSNGNSGAVGVDIVAASGGASVPVEANQTKRILFIPGGGPNRSLRSQKAFPPTSLTVNATVTLGALTSSAAATALVQASAAITLDALSSTATATVLDQASAAISLGALTSSATASAPLAEIGRQQGFLFRPGAGPSIWNWRGRVAYTVAPTVANATAAITLDALTSSATAADPVSASASITLGALTTASAVTDPVAAAAANTLGALTSTATATVLDQASAAITLGALTVAATVTDTPGLFASVTLDPLTAAATATATDAATAAITLGTLTTTATAAVKVSAAAAIALDNLTATATAAAKDSASAPITLGQLTASSIVVNLAAAQANITLGALVVAAAAKHPVPSTSNPVALMI